MFGTGVSWIQVSVHQFGLPVLAFSASVTLAFIAILALYPAAIGWFANRLFAAPGPVRGLLGLPALWVLGEWVRGWLFTGFPWLHLGYSQIDGPLAGLGPLVGVYGVSLATVYCAGLLYCIASGVGRRPCLLGLALIAAGSWALGQVAWTEPASGSIPVALVQGNVAQAIKWEPAERQVSIERYIQLTAPHWGKRLVVWPETAIPEFYTPTAPYARRLMDLSAESGTDLLLGVPYRSAEGSDYYNAVVSIGQSPGIYKKRHLVPFGEYLPFEGVLGGVLDFLEIPMSSFSAGSARQALLRAAGQFVGVSICYEDVFGEEVIETLPEARLLVNVSNDAWFGDSLAPHQHLEMARMRALEAGRFLLRATNTGVSAVIDPTGAVIARSPQFEAHALSAEVRAYRGATPYVVMGNGAALLLAVCMLIGARVGRRLSTGS
jgi:apolipoprotein N-acyltransferase